VSERDGEKSRKVKEGEEKTYAFLISSAEAVYSTPRTASYESLVSLLCGRGRRKRKRRTLVMIQRSCSSSSCGSSSGSRSISSHLELSSGGPSSGSKPTKRSVKGEVTPPLLSLSNSLDLLPTSTIDGEEDLHRLLIFFHSPSNHSRRLRCVPRLRTLHHVFPLIFFPHLNPDTTTNRRGEETGG
jgi:hypothetical protein